MASFDCTAVKQNSRQASGKKPFSRRTRFDAGALLYLETVFETEPYPDRELREELADKIGVDSSKIRMWFNNRRKKSRKARRTIKKDKEQAVETDIDRSLVTDIQDVLLCPIYERSPAPERPLRRFYSDSDLEDMCEIDTDATSDDEDREILSHLINLVVPQSSRSAALTRLSPDWVLPSLMSQYPNDYRETPLPYRL